MLVAALATVAVFALTLGIAGGRVPQPREETFPQRGKCGGSFSSICALSLYPSWDMRPWALEGLGHTTLVNALGALTPIYLLGSTLCLSLSSAP